MGAGSEFCNFGSRSSTYYRIQSLPPYGLPYSAFVCHPGRGASRDLVGVRLLQADCNEAERQEGNDPKHHRKNHIGPPPAQVDQGLTVIVVESHNDWWFAGCLEMSNWCHVDSRRGY